VTLPPGVTIRPILPLSGEHHFNEVASVRPGDMVTLVAVARDAAGGEHVVLVDPATCEVTEGRNLGVNRARP
jgi:hypothetical protein